jgi:hypothetical protein
LKYTDPSGHKPDEGEHSEKPKPQCNPNSSVPCAGEKYGLCIPGVGCSGGTDYREWWEKWYLPRMGGYIEDDIASAAQKVADPLGLGLDAYENWRGIPIPKKFGFGIDAVLQFLEDGPRSDLSILQKFGRAGVNGAEGVVVSGISSAAGVAAGDATLAVSLPIAVDSGQLWLPPVAYWSGYVSTHLAVNYALGSAANYVNTQLFPAIGFGVP